MIRFSLTLALPLALALVACDKDADGNTILDNAANDIKEVTGKEVPNVEEAVIDTKDKIVKEASAMIPNVKEILNADYSVENLKSKISSYTPESLKPVGDAVLTALQEKSGVISGIKDQISKLGSTELGKLKELKDQLGPLTQSFDGLKGKLMAIVDQLKSSGIDVSKYTQFLSGK